MKNFSKTLLVIMIGTMGISSCADSWEEMRKEKYEKEWVKTFGEVDPNHTWNLATQVTADLAIKEDALTEYTFKVYTSDPIWGTDAKLLAKATVKTDEVGYAETQIKFDAPSSQERYYITRTDSHGRRLLKVSDIENKKIGVKFGISNYSAESRALHNDASFESLKKGIPNPYTEEWVNKQLNDPNVKDFKDKGSITEIQNLGKITKVTENDFTMPESGNGFNYYVPNNSDPYTIIIKGNGVSLSTNSNKLTLARINIIIAPGASLTLNRYTELSANANIYIMEGGTLNAFAGVNPGTQSMQDKNISLRIESDNSILWNGGTLNIDYLVINNGEFYNSETGVLPGTGDPNEDPSQTIISFTQYEKGTLTNFGKIKAYRIMGNENKNTFVDAAAAQQNGTINNACFIDVEDRFCIRYLNLASNSTIESTSIAINSVTLRANSILKSESFGAQNGKWEFIDDNNNPTTGYALISTEEVNYLHNNGITVEGSIYFETNGYNSEKNYQKSNGETSNLYKDAIINAYNNNNTLKADAAISTVGNAPILIIPDHNYDGDDVSKYDCVGHGNIPQEFKDIIDKNIEWAIAFEDLGDIGDYDFNDVVIGVSQDGNKIKVTALAAGGTLPADVYYKNEKLGEIHELLNRAGDYSPINVKNKRNEESGKRKIYKIDPDDFSIEENWTDFTIRVNGKASATITPDKMVGNVPQALCIPSDWLWPKESINIHDAYADFTNWAKDQNNYKTWYKKHTNGKVAVNQ